MQKARLRLQDK